MRVTGLALALSTLVLASDLEGQVSLDSAVKALKPDERVLIRVRGGEKIESRIMSLEAAPLGLRLMDHPALLHATDIDSLWIRGRATGAGTNSGAIIGGILSFAFAAAVCSGVSEGAGCDAWGTVAAFGVAGVIGGSFIGAGIGSLVPRWQLRYPGHRLQR